MPGQDPMLTATLIKSFPCSGLRFRFPMCRLHGVNDLLAAPTFNRSLTLPKSPHGKRSTSQCRWHGQGLDSRSTHRLLCSALLLFSKLDHCYCFLPHSSQLHTPSGEPRPLSKGPKPRQTQSKVLVLSCPQPGYLETHEVDNWALPKRRHHIGCPGVNLPDESVCLSRVQCNQPVVVLLEISKQHEKGPIRCAQGAGFSTILSVLSSGQAGYPKPLKVNKGKNACRLHMRGYMYWQLLKQKVKHSHEILKFPFKKKKKRGGG